MPTPPTLLPAPQALEVVAFRADASLVTVMARPRATSAPCPRCGQVSSRVHSRYHRRVLALPWAGVTVRLELSVRRFF